LCHLVPFAQGISVYVSTLTLTSIAVDRFFVIIYPFRPRMKLSTCIAIIIAIWVFAILITLPYCIYMFQKPIDGKYYCEEQWPVDIVGMVSFVRFVIDILRVTGFLYVTTRVRCNGYASELMPFCSCEKLLVSR
jgi:neuropeptide Y receptor